MGNAVSAFLGFLFTLFIARTLTVSDFGIFSAVNNLVLIISSLSDVGISSALVNFVSESVSKGEREYALKIVKASFLLRFVVVSTISLLVFLFSKQVSLNLLATSDIKSAYWVVVIVLSFFSINTLVFVLQAKREFVKSTLPSIVLGAVRTAIVFGLLITGFLTLNLTYFAYIIGALAAVGLGLKFVGVEFIKVKPGRKVYKRIIKFSGWIGVNRIISAISGRLDVTMLAAIAGAQSTGIYSVSSRLALYVVVLSASYSSVLATRLAAFGDKEKEIAYIKKSLIALLPIVGGLIIWILIAHPFITILFGIKYEESVPVFRALIAAMIPFMLTPPAVTTIIYAIKKPVYIGVFSFFQIAIIFILNSIFIKQFGVLGPTITLGIFNTVLLLYVWGVVVRHYRN